MRLEDDIQGGISFRREYRPLGQRRVEVFFPSRSRGGWMESLMLVVGGLLGGFGLGLAYAMLMIIG